ncbi:MAG: hypothetical protein ACX94B_01175 [Henriciella sp.]
MVRLREIFHEELSEMAQGTLSSEPVSAISQAIPEELLVKYSASGSLTRALGQMCLKAQRTVGEDGKLSLYVRAMPDGSDAICFIVRGIYGKTAPAPKDKVLVEHPENEEEVTLDAYASYMSATHIENLGGQYREDLDGDKSVNLIAIVPSSHVQTGEALKALPPSAIGH